MTDSKLGAEERVRHEFNQWASEGKGEEMEAHHISITEQTLAMMIRRNSPFFVLNVTSRRTLRPWYSLATR